jgi:hypothetical protein
MLFSLISLLASTASASPTARWVDGRVLNSSYLNPHFTQSRSNINSYTSMSIASLIQATNHSDGQILGGNYPLGSTFYWQSQNAWTTVAAFDTAQKSNTYMIDVVSAQSALARSPGDGFQQWSVPLVNYYNDDPGWAALANIQAYEAYGRGIELQRAIGVWEVSKALSSRFALTCVIIAVHYHAWLYHAREYRRWVL